MDIDHCYRHPERATRIHCQRCDRPVCPSCMVEGAVGFHCPECVKANPTPKMKARKIRPGMETAVAIVAVNVIIWLAITFTGGASSIVTQTLALLPRGFCLVPDGRILMVVQAECVGSGLEWRAGVATGAPWQLITSAFTHIEVWHIMFNMMALLILGPQVEQALGRARFLAIYFFSALAGSVMVMAFTSALMTLGASGAVFGLMGAFLVLALRQKSSLTGIFVWLGLNAAFTFIVPNVSWEGHLGGLLGGIAITALFAYLPYRRRKWEWWLAAGLTVILLAVVAAMVIVQT